jgi:putative ABC transport system substrate-binding protein
MRKKITGLALSTMLSALSYLGAMLLALSFPAEAQQAGKIPRVGFISSAGSPENPWPPFEAFRQGLRELGYVEGKNLLIEHRYGEGRLDRMPDLVNELLQQKVDVFVATNNVAIRVAKKATKTIPILMVSSIDPVAAGYVDSLARPGANITGLAFLARELSAKRVELLKEILPRMSRIAILWNPEGPGPTVAFKEYQSAATAFKLNLQSLEVRGPNPDFEDTFQAAKKGRAEALIIVENPLIHQHLKQILELATKTRLPSMNENNLDVEAGGLLSYGANYPDLYRHAATYVDKILKGAKPADLPVEQPTKFELVINLKTAKQIGLTIPPWLLMRADKVIK